ncbi:AAA family ATPase [Candidatus Daviesbacteria bacterium]|nr:AAA family ATPase [Candidatus Daviesbacteria bacterium]
MLPIHLIEFWYPEGIAFFIRIWRNLMLLLEEDLAVGLMLKLLFVPLFHDATIVGRVLSFLFRIIRIFIGVFAFTLATLILFLIGGYWFSLPVLAFFDTPPLMSRILFFSGSSLFLIHVFTHPHKKVWSIRSSDNPEDIWQACQVKPKDLSLKKLLSTFEVSDLLSNLEVQLNGFPDFEITDKDKTIKKAFELAKNSSSKYIGARHFFVAALFEIPNIDQFLLKLGLIPTDFVKALSFLEKKRQTWRRVWIWDEDFAVRHLKGVNRGWLGAPTPQLDLAGEDLTKSAAKSADSEFIRTNTVVSDVVNILSQTSGRNIILVGPSGCGKSALIRHLAKMIVLGDAPPSLATKRLVMLDLTKLLSGISNQGELALRVKNIFEEVEFAQNVIIVIEEIHQLGMGEAGNSFNLYSLMQPYIESNTFQFIGITELENYSKILEKNASFARNFRKVEMPPATEVETLDILEYRSIDTERKSKTKVTFIALKEAIELSKKFIKDRVLPDSAISVIKEAVVQAANGWVTKGVVKRVVSSRVKIPLLEVGTVQKDKLLNLESEIHKIMIDQEQAVKVISDTLRRSVVGLREEARPIGSFLFVGPTGVGKTEMAKTLAQVYFGDKDTFIRFDMSEYQNPESVARLIGKDGEGGLLTEAVRNRPYALILLDEFEKANEKILTLFLQVLDDGRLTDGMGRTIGFENTIIIATSNIGSLLIAQGLQSGKGMDEIERWVNDEMLKVLRPELVNRFDDIIIFKPLSEGDLGKIVALKLKVLQDQMRQKGFVIEFTPQLVAELGKRGFDPVLGARPLRRLIQDTLEAELSKLILENKLSKGQPFEAGVELLG